MDDECARLLSGFSAAMAQVDALIADLQRVRNSIVTSTETEPKTLRSGI